MGVCVSDAPSKAQLEMCMRSCYMYNLEECFCPAYPNFFKKLLVDLYDVRLFGFGHALVLRLHDTSRRRNGWMFKRVMANDCIFLVSLSGLW